MSELNYLAHYQVEGAEHGYRRYQNYDGSLTPLGRIHYGVGEARKKASATAKKASGAIKNAPKNIAKAAKKTASDLSKARAAYVKASQKRKTERQKRKQEALSRKVADKIAKTKISQLKDQLEEAKIERARQRVEALLAKQDRMQEAAFLKAQEKMLKKENKRLKKNVDKDAEKSLSKKQIAQLTDEEVDSRLARLKKEAELAKYEAERLTPTAMNKLTDELIRQGSQAAGSVAKDLATRLGKKWLGLDDPPDTPKGRADKMRDILSEMKAEKELNDWVDNLARNDEDDELARQARRAQNKQTIANANKSIEAKPSADERSKDFARQVAERKEDERRAQNFYKDGEGLSIAEIAKRMGISETKVKDLIYI